MLRKPAYRGACLVAVAVSMNIQSAAAQDIAGALPTREQIELPSTDERAPQGGVDVDGRIAREPCPFETSTLSVDLQRIRFADSDGSALPPAIAAELADIAPTPGQQPVANLCALRDAANDRLFAAGYIASVQIPPQEITTGDAVLHVTLARIVDVQVQGAPGPYAATLQSRIAMLKALDPVNRFEAERILLLAGDVPGLDVALKLRPAGTRAGEVIGDLVIRYTPWTLIGNAQNHGSRFIGRTSGTLRAEYYGLTGLSDRTFVGATATADFDEQFVLQGGHYFGDHRGNTAGLRISRAWSRPDTGALDLRSRSLIAGVDFNMPIVRSVTRNIAAGGGLELINQRVKLHLDDGSLPVTRDKLRVAFARLAWSTREPRFSGPDKYALGGSVELRRGVDLFDATNRGELTSDGYAPSRAQGDPTATVIRGGLDGSAAAGLFSLGASVQGQWANNPLLSIEEFSVGNLTLGRGYDPGVTSGDRALGLRIEPRVQLPLRGDVGAQLFGFHDRVRIWNLDDFTTEDGRTLGSWGGGMRVSLPGRLLLEAMYARPMDRGLATDTRRAPDRFLLSLTTQFSPSAR